MKTSPGRVEPARCGGLRQALLHAGPHGFPLDASPFHVLGRRLGGTLREVLVHCQSLADEGSLQGIRAHWGASLHRVRWRCGLRLAAPPGAALKRDIAALPGVAAWYFVEPDRAGADPRRGAAGGPNLWFDLVARQPAAAQRQFDALQAQHGPLSRLVLDDGLQALRGCECMHQGGPCGDPELARHCEAGLPLVARPYHLLSETLRRSERDVLASLRRWQRSGRLQRLGLGTTGSGAESPCTVAALGGEALDAGAQCALLARPGVVEVQALPPHPDWPWRTLVMAAGAPAQAAAALDRALAACALAARPCRLLRLRRVRVRESPRLFDDGVGAASVEEASAGASAADRTI